MSGRIGGRGHQDIFADDIQWAKGSSEGIDYARFVLDEGNPMGPMVILSKFAPGETVEPHTHETNYFEYVIDGEQTVGKVTFRQGDVRLVTGGTGYGPITIGPRGCTVLIVFQEAAKSIMVPKGAAAAAAA